MVLLSCKTPSPASKDAIKDVRKEAAKHNPNHGQNLRTVLVKLRNEEIRGKIMKKKKDLEHHPTQLLKELIIKNANVDICFKERIIFKDI